MEFTALSESAINREESYVDGRFDALEAMMNQSLKHMEHAVVDCMLRRDEKWRKELSKLKATSTPQTPQTVPHWSLDASDIPRGELNCFPVNLLHAPCLCQISHLWRK